MHSGYAGHSDHARLFSRQACTWRQFVLHTVIPAVDAFLHLGCPHQAYHCSSPFLAQTTLSIYPFVPPRIILPIDSLARTASWPLTPSEASPLTFARNSATPNHKSFTRTACPICQRVDLACAWMSGPFFSDILERTSDISGVPGPWCQSGHGSNYDSIGG